ncbi:MAG: tetratricopeptide repeat protein [Gemmatimonadota bacterium]|nr:MAG: tetratricopeptide repeat protein [Gemmatimonadota bacterium]
MPPDSDVQKEIEQLEQRYAENSQGLVFAHLADAYRRAGEYGKAEGLVLHGLKNHPNYISAYNVLGRVYVDSERYSDAHEQFSKVLELDPQNMIAMRALGDLAVRGGRLEDARIWYERILQIDPRNEEAQEELEKLIAGGVAPSPQPAAAPEPAVPEAAAAPEEAAPSAEDAAAPWEAGGAPEGAGEVGPLEVPAEPVEELLGGEETAAPEVEMDVSDTMPTMAWEGLTDAESFEASSVEPLEEEPPVQQVEGLEAFEERTPEEPAAMALSERGADIDLGDLEEWTPGFLREEDMEGQAGEDLGVGSMVQEFGGPGGLEPAVADEDTGAEPEEASPVREEVVTETMAELYADQGLLEDALGVYRRLAETRPEDERIRTRIAELERQIASEMAAPDSGADLAELLDLTETDLSGELEIPEPPAFEESTAAELIEPPAAFGETYGVELGDIAAEATEATPAAAELAEAPTGDSGFEFEDEAPLAGMEHLDPFASSFDVMVKRADQAPLAAGVGGLADLSRPEAAEPAAPTAETALEPVQVEPELEIVPTLEELTPELEVVPAADLLPAGADVVPPPERPAPVAEVSGLTAEMPTVTPAEPRVEAPTIEEYLSSLLAYDPEARTAAAPPAADDASAPADAADSEDLEQFQEWLRSLKE